MFDVLAFVFDNYLHRDVCPELPTLHRQLSAVGFDLAEIQDALIWLEELKHASHDLTSLPVPGSSGSINPAPYQNTDVAGTTRVFSAVEQKRLGCAGWGFLLFLMSAGALPWERLELVMDRIMAASHDELSLEDLKLIVLMVFWSLGEEPDALVLDELCDNHALRLAN